MTKNILLVLFVYSMISCNNRVDKDKELINEASNIETKQEEPTKPEETEVWQPIPKQIDPVGQNGVPSDAIILFDGSNLNAWESSNEGGGIADWVLNSDGSMTVKDQAGGYTNQANFWERAVACRMA